jgi:hypothetical protein
MRDVCGECGRRDGHLFVIEVEDVCGVWHQWCCPGCLDGLARELEGGESPDLVRLTLYEFDLPDFGAA